MSVITAGTTFSNGEQLTADKLNLMIRNATFDNSAVDLTSTFVDSNGAIVVRDDGITEAKIASNAVTTNKIADANVTFGKLTNVIDDDTMATASATTLATSESIKAYIDGMRPKFVALTGGTIDLVKTTSSVSSVDYTYNIADFTSADSDFATNKIVALIVESFTSSGANLNKVQVRLPNDDFTTIGSTSADSTADFTQDNATSNIPINSGQSSIVISHVVGNAESNAATSRIKGAIILPNL